MTVSITQNANKTFSVAVSSVSDAPATVVAHVKAKCKPKSIASFKLTYVAATLDTTAWQHALTLIAPYFAAGVSAQAPQAVMPAPAAPAPSATSSTAGMFGSGLGLGALSQFDQANQAALFQMQATNMQQAQTLYTQVAADAQKQQTERWKIMQDTQTRIFEITQDVTVNKAKSADKAFKAMDGYIRG
jgi:hypothetical protein